MEEIKFKQLSWPCKVGVIAGWMELIVWIMAFFVGFVIGLTG